MPLGHLTNARLYLTAYPAGSDSEDADRENRDPMMEFGWVGDVIEENVVEESQEEAEPAMPEEEPEPEILIDQAFIEQFVALGAALMNMMRLVAPGMV